MKIDLSQFRETFLQESAEHIVHIENGLLQLKSFGADDETLNSIFRAAHSIKGGAGSFGLTEVVKFTHVLENLFDRMREHRVELSAPLIALLLRANDVLKSLIGFTDGSVPHETAEVQLALEKASADAGSAPAASAAPIEAGGKSDSESGQTEYTISFRPGADIFAFGSDPLAATAKPGWTRANALLRVGPAESAHDSPVEGRHLLFGMEDGTGYGHFSARGRRGF